MHYIIFPDEHMFVCCGNGSSLNPLSQGTVRVETTEAREKPVADDGRTNHPEIDKNHENMKIY